MKKLLIVMLSVFTGTAFAAGYGTAGCGLGSMVLGEEKGMMQIFASTLNGLGGNQTFAMSSGTSNCAEGGKTPTQFIEVNKSALSNDIARGEGSTLAALSEIYGCQDVQSFGKTLKSNYSRIFKTEESSKINSNIINVIKKSNISCNDLV